MDAVEDLLKKQEAFEKMLQTQEERFQQLLRETKVLLHSKDLYCYFTLLVKVEKTTRLQKETEQKKILEEQQRKKMEEEKKKQEEVK